MVFGLSIFFISNIYAKWQTAPIIIALNAEATRISDIPFPAVTICNMNKAKKSIAADIIPGTNEDALLQSLCADQTNITKGEQTNWLQFRQFLINVIFLNNNLTRTSSSPQSIFIVFFFFF